MFSFLNIQAITQLLAELVIIGSVVVFIIYYFYFPVIDETLNILSLKGHVGSVATTEQWQNSRKETNCKGIGNKWLLLCSNKIYFVNPRPIAECPAHSKHSQLSSETEVLCLLI